MSTDSMKEGIGETTGGQPSLVKKLGIVTLSEHGSPIDFMLEFSKDNIVLLSTTANRKSGLLNGSNALEQIGDQLVEIGVRVKVEDTDFGIDRRIVKSLVFPLAQT